MNGLEQQSLDQSAGRECCYRQSLDDAWNVHEKVSALPRALLWRQVM